MYGSKNLDGDLAGFIKNAKKKGELL